jgi:hypothetical protein
MVIGLDLDIIFDYFLQTRKVKMIPRTVDLLLNTSVKFGENNGSFSRVNRIDAFSESTKSDYYATCFD